MNGRALSRWSTVGGLALVTSLPTFAAAQAARPSPRTVSGPSRTTTPRFAHLEGTYRYHGSLTAALVATDTGLVAVIEDAKYPLRPIGGDRFLNPAGDTIPFRRSASGTVEGFAERGVFFPRMTPNVESAARLLLAALPVEESGTASSRRYASPAALGDGIAVGDLAHAGYDSTVVRRLVEGVAAGKYADLHGVLVYRKGRLVLEQYFYGFDVDRPHQLRSATKSVVSALVGIALDRRLLPGLQERILPRFPYTSYRNPHPTKAALTLEDLLTHRTGIACDDWDRDSPGQEMRVMASGDWVKRWLDLPVIGARGAKGHYCSAGVLAAGRLVELASGERLPAFAQRVLFDPLGIRAADVRWKFTLDSTNVGTAAQLYLRPRDMLKLGILYAQQGRWNGRQVVSAEWVRRSTTEHTVIGDEGHGYYWWVKFMNVPTPAGNQRVDMVSAAGNGGQKIVIVPKLDLVVVLPAGAYNAESPSNPVLAEVLLPPLLTGR